MTPPGLMSPNAIRKEIERRNLKMVAARRSGRVIDAGRHQQRIEDLNAQLERGEKSAAEWKAHADATAPTAPAAPTVAQTPPRDLEPSSDTAWDAVPKVAAILAQYGPALTIRALDHALLNFPVTATQAADPADGVRMIQMRRRHSTPKEAAQ